MSPAVAPWVDVATAVVVVAGALAALAGSWGLVRFGTFFQRVHPPTLGSTVGTWSLVLATALQVSFARGQLFAHALLIALFLAATAPVTTIFLMRAALFRRRAGGAEAPPPVGDRRGA